MIQSMKKCAILWPIAFLFLLSSCNGVMLPDRTCQANSSRLMPSNGVPPGERIVQSTSVGNESERIDFLTIASDLTAGELLAHYNNQTESQRNDWSLVQSGGDAHAVWSSWTVVDECNEEWDGLIMISKPPSTVDPFMVIRVRKKDSVETDAPVGQVTTQH